MAQCLCRILANTKPVMPETLLSLGSARKSQGCGEVEAFVEQIRTATWPQLQESTYYGESCLWAWDRGNRLLARLAPNYLKRVSRGKLAQEPHRVWLESTLNVYDKSKESQGAADLAQAIYAVMVTVCPVDPWALEQIKQTCPKTLAPMMGAEVIGFLAVQEKFEAEVLQITLQ